MRDTSEEARVVQENIHRRLGGTGRIRLAIEMSVVLRDLALAGLRARYPERSHRELILELHRLHSLPKAGVRVVE